MTIDFESNFDFGSFFGRDPPPPVLRTNERNNRTQGNQSTVTPRGSEDSNARGAGRSQSAAEIEPSLHNLIHNLNHRANVNQAQGGENASPDPIAEVSCP